jgi:HPt (histidine-containing phosphotransfer) domain-containing protein
MRQHGTAVARPDDRRQTPSDPGDEVPEVSPAVDVTVIEQLASITDDQGSSVLGELLNAFLGNVPARLEALDHAVAGGDLAGLADQAHALTGSAASFGARGMADLCRGLRIAAVRGDADAVGDIVLALHDEFARVQAWLADFRSDR